MKNEESDNVYWYGLALLVWSATVYLELRPQQPFMILGGACLIIGLFGGTNGVRKRIFDIFYWGRSKAPEARRQVGLALLSLLSTSLKASYEHVEKAREAKEKRNTTIDLCEEFLKVTDEVGMHTPEIAATEKQAVADAVIEEGESIEKTTVYQKAAEEILPEEDHHRTEARLITILSYEIDEAESTPTEAKYKAEIDTLLSGVSFHPLDKRAKIILSVYQSFRQESWKEHDPGEVFDHIRDPDDALVREFMRKYTDRTIYQYLTSNEEQAREFRDTLADLIRLGRVDIGSLTQDVIQEKVDKVKQELREANDRYSSYLVLSMKLMTAEDKHGVVDEFESNFPLTIRWKGRSVAGEGYPSPKFLSMRATYANQTYESAADFLEEEIKPLLPPQDEWEDGSFVAVMPFEAPSYEAFPKKETVIEESSDWYEGKIEKNFEAMELLTVGREAVVADLVAADIRHEVDVEELLRVIPINVVAPELSRDEKHFIQDRYKPLKDKFPEVETLFDWGGVAEKELADALKELDEDGDVTDSWEDVATQLREGVVDCAEASGISVFSKTTSERSSMPA